MKLESEREELPKQLGQAPEVEKDFLQKINAAAGAGRITRDLIESEHEH